MDGRIGNRQTTPLHGLRAGPARTAPLGQAARFADDALALSARGGQTPVEPAQAAEARRLAEQLWAQPAAPAADHATEAPASGTEVQTGAWGGAGEGAQVAKDLADVNDPRLTGTQAAAGKLDAAVANIQWHWKRAGFGGPEGHAKAVAYLGTHADAFDQRMTALATTDPKAHARWSRLSGPILGLGDAQTNATAVVLAQAALATGDWGPLEDLGRRTAQYAGGTGLQASQPERAALGARARTQVAANAALERQALAALTPGERVAFEQVRKALGDDPHAQLALQLLALEGKLGQPADASLIAALGQVASQPLAAGLDRRDLLATLVRETATPSAISQKDGTWTCTATVAQIMVALERPAEYVRIVGGLASPSGRVKLASGATIERAAGSAGGDLTGRTSSARLWQAALMEHANGADRYDAKLDMNKRADGTTYKGLIGVEAQERLFGGVTGRKGELLGGDKAGGDSQATLARVKEELGKGHPVAANYFVREGVGHQVLITSAAAGFVTYVDPMGLEKRLPEAEFAKNLFMARVDAR